MTIDINIIEYQWPSWFLMGAAILDPSSYRMGAANLGLRISIHHRCGDRHLGVWMEAAILGLTNIYARPVSIMTNRPTIDAGHHLTAQRPLSWATHV